MAHGRDQQAESPDHGPFYKYPVAPERAHRLVLTMLTSLGVPMR